MPWSIVIASESEAIHEAAKKVWIASSREFIIGPAEGGTTLAPRNDDTGPGFRRDDSGMHTVKSHPN
jgi:hypothetical protein